jgi:hypothetical protein
MKRKHENKVKQAPLAVIEYHSPSYLKLMILEIHGPHLVKVFLLVRTLQSPKAAQGIEY